MGLRHGVEEDNFGRQRNGRRYLFALFHCFERSLRYSPDNSPNQGPVLCSSLSESQQPGCKSDASKQPHVNLPDKNRTSAYYAYCKA